MLNRTVGHPERFCLNFKLSNRERFCLNRTLGQLDRSLSNELEPALQIDDDSDPAAGESREAWEAQQAQEKNRHNGFVMDGAELAAVNLS